MKISTQAVNHWLLKSEPDTFGLDRLRELGRTEWSGVRNFQARNNMMAMKLGDLGFFYHSSTAIPGIAGVCRVVREAYPDFTAWDPKSEYFDPKSTQKKPIWMMVDVAFEEELPRFVPLAELRANPWLDGMVLLKRARLSVQPVTPAEWELIVRLAQSAPPHGIAGT